MSRSCALLYGDVSQLGAQLGGDSVFHLPERRCPVPAKSEASTAGSPHGGQLWRMLSLWKLPLGLAVSLRWNGPSGSSCRCGVWGEKGSYRVFGIVVLSAVNLNYSEVLFGLFSIIFMNTVHLQGSVIATSKSLLIFKIYPVGVIGSCQCRRVDS